MEISDDRKVERRDLEIVVMLRCVEGLVSCLDFLLTRERDVFVAEEVVWEEVGLVRRCNVGSLFLLQYSRMSQAERVRPWKVPWPMIKRIPSLAVEPGLTPRETRNVALSVCIFGYTMFYK